VAEAVIDASAVLAYLRGEDGAAVVEGRIADCILSSVNAGEVVTKLIARGAGADAAVAIVRLLPCPIVAVDADLGLRAGALSALASEPGLSLGDRVCLGLAERENLPALTADRAWLNLGGAIQVEMIR
jgi:PIN domain nuclease of toxin-antitoxin system